MVDAEEKNIENNNNEENNSDNNSLENSELKKTSKDSDIENEYQNDESQQEASREEQLSEEIIEIKEEKIRLLAEMENLRKRFEKEKTDSIKFGSTNIIREMLSPGDNLERALAAIPEKETLPDSIKNLIQGLKMVQREFNSILEKNGVKKIAALNEKFDHNYHQAMMEIEKDDVDEGVVVQEIQPGYTMHDRLLRPAMVGVSKKVKKENTGKNTENSNKNNNINKKNKENK
tara:strand:- start:1582 stop:2277 length:696 start_codon:yes stop_codon:yes gene_type:complete